MRKLLLLFLFICGLVLHAQAQKNVELSSPNGEIKVSVRLTDKIYYDVACNDEVLLKDNYHFQCRSRSFSQKDRFPLHHCLRHDRMWSDYLLQPLGYIETCFLRKGHHANGSPH